MNLPLKATRHLLENCAGYDLVGYMEDDITIEDDYFPKNRLRHRDIPKVRNIPQMW